MICVSGSISGAAGAAEGRAVGLALQPLSLDTPSRDSWLHFPTGVWGRVLGDERLGEQRKAWLEELYSDFTERTTKGAGPLSMDACCSTASRARRGSGEALSPDSCCDLRLLPGGPLTTAYPPALL